MALFSKELRQRIVQDFAIRHNGQFNPKLFLEEVRRTGAEHPAYEWFQWDVEKAAQEYQLWQAREFSRDLKVTFTVEQIGATGAIKVIEADVPLVISPRRSRQDGGGYVLVDPRNPEHMAEHCHQAAAALRAWLDRYGGALIHAGRQPAEIEDVAGKLESVPGAPE